MVAAGGAVHVFRPRSSGEGLGRAWYPPWNAGSSSYLCTTAGAEMTSQEVVFIPGRFKDGYGPVGAWFLLFKSIATNAQGGNYMQDNAAELDKWEPYGKVKPRPANIRNWLMMMDVADGKSPIYMQTAEAIQRIAETAPDEKAAKKKLKELEAEAWEDFLDMTISQAILWAATNVEPEKIAAEVTYQVRGTLIPLRTFWYSGDRATIRLANRRLQRRIRQLEADRSFSATELRPPAEPAPGTGTKPARRPVEPPVATPPPAMILIWVAPARRL